MGKSFKTMLVLSLCLLVVLSMLAGCSGTAGTNQQNISNQQSGAQNTTTPQPEPVKEPLLITMINRVGATVSFENNDYIKAIEEVANVKLEIEAPPINNYNDRLKILMASGDYPDIVYVWLLDNFYEMWAAEGLLISVDDKVANYPNLLKNITPNMWEATKVSATGKMHGVPKPNKVNYWGYVANQGWLNKLGVEAPTTVDELYEVAKAVAKGDPNETGKDDTYAISPIGLSGQNHEANIYQIT